MPLRVPRPDTKHWVAVGLIALIIIWFATGTIRSAREEAPVVVEQDLTGQYAEVLVREVSAEDYQAEIPIQGYLRAWEQIALRARVGAQVLALPVPQGSEVEAGTVLIELDAENRQARVSQLQAEVELAQVELAAAQRLQRDDLVAQTERLRLAANLARAAAEFEAVQLQLDYTKVRAPFNGLYDRRLVDRGDYVQVGQEVLVFADITRLRAIASVPQQRVGSLEVGQVVVVDLLGGGELHGEVIYFSRIGDAQTRSFEVEVAVDNPQRRPLAGASANLRIRLNPQRAHRLEPSLLRLDGDGRTMVRIVNQQHEVEEVPVEVLSMGRDYVMVSGLPAIVRVVTQGAGLVQAGQRVEVAEAEPAGLNSPAIDGG